MRTVGRHAFVNYALGSAGEGGRRIVAGYCTACAAVHAVVAQETAAGDDEVREEDLTSALRARMSLVLAGYRVLRATSDEGSPTE